MLGCHSGTMLEEVNETPAAETLLKWKLHSLLSDSDPSWVYGLPHFPPLPSYGLILNRIHQQSEREASSPSWKRTSALVKGGQVEMLLKNVSCWRQRLPSSSQWLSFQALAPSLMAMPSLEPGNWDKAVLCSRR